MAHARRLQPLDHTPVRADRPDWSFDRDDDEAEIRFSLTALGEAIVTERDGRRPRFRGFGPCGTIVA